MLRHAAATILATGALLLAPATAAAPDVPGDPTPPAITVSVAGTLGENGWYRTNVTLNWSVSDPESTITSSSGCDAVTFTSDTTGVSRTCSASSDGGTTSVTKPIKLDKTAPGVTPAAARAANSNGWYNSAVAVNFSGSDATSGLVSCDAAKTYSGPDSAGASVSGSCRDQAGNIGSGSITLKYDATEPTATAAPGRAANANGWYNSAVAVNFSGSDATSSPVSCDAAKTYSGPDSSSASVSGSCRDQAGNTRSASVTLKYDATEPTATAAPGRAANANGWYNSAVAVNFSGSDATSGPVSCDAAKTYSGPDNSAASVSGACRDQAGNSRSASVTLKYDATAPTASAAAARAAGPTGWYNTPLAVSFSGADVTSAPVSCDATKTYSGPDSSSASVTGSCRDQAGNSTSAALTLKYDDTAPEVTLVPERSPDANGWFNHPVTVAFSGTDATSGLSSCDGPKTYAGPDASSASVGGSCRDRAGNSGGAAIGLPYDATAPAVSAAPARAADSNGWYNNRLEVSFQGSDPTSGIETCTGPVGYDGPDSRNASLAGACRDRAGNTSGASFAFRYDGTAPQVSAVPDRAPDSGGWYNRPLKVAFSGSDATAGVVEACSSTAYSGPDDSTASAWGTCRDAAGNVGLGLLSFKYDDTAPAIGALRVKPGNRSAQLSWKASGDAHSFELRREPGAKGDPETVVYRGSGNSFRDKGLKVAVKYRYTLVAQDGAANTANESASLTARGPLLDPAPGERVTSPPRLVWTPVKGATYYHVQLLRDRRVLSAWPTRASYQVPPTWRYAGKRYRLRPGVYRWYVWPGHGRPAEARYGERIGGSSFVVRG